MSEVSPLEPIIHVFVVGFHHKKGCIVEYSYPSIFKEENVTSHELPDPWKHLPTLALPDGAHNYEEDTIYFHLPSLENPHQTVFGISCYRQMNAQKLINRSSDITRETVQKSVCVLSRIPLYGLIQAKLELITHAYFDERDFSKVALLEETFKNLNSSLPKDLLDGQQAFLGLSVRDFVLRFKHKTLLLFKLLLLERKVLFYKAPVKNLCSTLLTLCSLMPGMIEKGLNEAATSLSSRSLPLLTFSDKDDFIDTLQENNNETCQNAIINHCSSEDHASNSAYNENEHSKNNNSYTVLVQQYSGDITDEKIDNLNELKCHSVSRPKSLTTKKVNVADSEASSQNSSDTEGDSWVKVNHITPDIGSSATSITSSTGTETKVDTAALNDDEKLIHAINKLLDGDDKTKKLNNSSLEFQDDVDIKNSPQDAQIIQNVIPAINDGISNIMSSLRGSKSSVLPSSTSAQKEDSSDTRRWSASHTQSEELDDSDAVKKLINVLDLEPDDCGLPLCIFSKGMLCFPYLSLPYLDILCDLNIRGFLVGATNILFKQKKQLFDVIIEVDEGKIEIVDPDLKKQLNLTTEDLRFADHLVRHVMEDKKDVFLDGTGWEGGDEWLRSQFKLYLLSLMRTSEVEVSGKEWESFNVGFMNSWKSTHSYKMWSSSCHRGILEVNPGHPFHGQLSMADMKLKFSHSMQSSERGRRLNSAVVSTGKAVVQTGKVVGGALTSAKSVVSSWWSNLSVPQLQEKQEENSDQEFQRVPTPEIRIQEIESESQ